MLSLTEPRNPTALAVGVSMLCIVLKEWKDYAGDTSSFEIS